MNRHALVLLTGIFLSIFPAQAAPLCTQAPLSDYLANTQGCMVGAFTFKNFAWVQSGPIAVPSTGVQVSPYDFTTRLGLNYSSNLFSVTGNEVLRYVLEYTVDPPPPIIDGFELGLDAGSPVAPGTATITADLCAGDLRNTGCLNGFPTSLQVNHFGTSSFLFDSVTFPQGVNLVDVRLLIELKANGASSQIDGFGNGASGLPTPEPGGLAVAGLGVLLVLSRSSAFRSRLTSKSTRL